MSVYILLFTVNDHHQAWWLHAVYLLSGTMSKSFFVYVAALAKCHPGKSRFSWSHEVTSDRSALPVDMRSC